MDNTAEELPTIWLTNTLSRKKELLKTLKPKHVLFYSCGPTVYSWIHLGNLRGALVADLLVRYLKRVGYEVTYVRNYTDIDDKIIQKAAQEKITTEQVAKKYIEEVEKDYAAVNLLEPTYKTRVTEHIPAIIDLIQKLIDCNKAYVLASGEVLFSVDECLEYGVLSHKKKEDLVAGIRIQVDVLKRNPLDFTLWKPAKKSEPFWQSPWGLGRPGWHIECSAMAKTWLGDLIDIHHGGEDLIFPHHENEIAQSEGASGKKPFSKIWVHHAFLTLSQEKMSKSLGNIFTVREFFNQFSPEVARYILLSVHYRTIVDLTYSVIKQSVMSLQRLYEAKQKAEKIAEFSEKSLLDASWGKFLEQGLKAQKKIEGYFSDDLNTSAVLATLFTLIRQFYRALTASPHLDSGADQGAKLLLKIMNDDIGEVMGIGKLSASKALEDLARMRNALQQEDQGCLKPTVVWTRPSDEEIQQAIDDRTLARKNKDFDKADAIRQQLYQRGVVLQDSASGTTWSYR